MWTYSRWHEAWTYSQWHQKWARCHWHQTLNMFTLTGQGMAETGHRLNDWHQSRTDWSQKVTQSQRPDYWLHVRPETHHHLTVHCWYSALQVTCFLLLTVGGVLNLSELEILSCACSLTSLAARDDHYHYHDLVYSMTLTLQSACWRGGWRQKLVEEVDHLYPAAALDAEAGHHLQGHASSSIEDRVDLALAVLPARTRSVDGWLWLFKQNMT